MQLEKGVTFRCFYILLRGVNNFCQVAFKGLSGIESSEQQHDYVWEEQQDTFATAAEKTKDNVLQFSIRNLRGCSLLCIDNQFHGA